jgi:hypothetical protein
MYLIKEIYKRFSSLSGHPYLVGFDPDLHYLNTLQNGASSSC